MEDGSLVVQSLSRLPRALFACAERPKVFGRLGRSVKQAHDDAAAIGRPFNFDVKEYLMRHLFAAAIK